MSSANRSVRVESRSGIYLAGGRVEQPPYRLGLASIASTRASSSARLLHSGNIVMERADFA
jgi:hypothetical protein